MNTPSIFKKNRLQKGVTLKYKQITMIQPRKRRVLKRAISQSSKIMSDYNLYSLIEHSGTNQLHLFKSKIENGITNFEDFSTCNRRIFSKSGIASFLNAEENEARIKCAEIGRPVCGKCVSTLYADYPNGDYLANKKGSKLILPLGLNFG